MCLSKISSTRGRCSKTAPHRLPDPHRLPGPHRPGPLAPFRTGPFRIGPFRRKPPPAGACAPEAAPPAIRIYPAARGMTGKPGGGTGARHAASHCARPPWRHLARDRGFRGQPGRRSRQGRPTIIGRPWLRQRRTQEISVHAAMRRHGVFLLHAFRVSQRMSEKTSRRACRKEAESCPHAPRPCAKYRCAVGASRLSASTRPGRHTPGGRRPATALMRRAGHLGCMKQEATFKQSRAFGCTGRTCPCGRSAGAENQFPPLRVISPPRDYSASSSAPGPVIIASATSSVRVRIAFSRRSAISGFSRR